MQWVKENSFAFIALGTLMAGKVAYEMLPLPVSILLAAIVTTVLVTLRKNKGKVSDRSSKKANRTAETLLAELDEQESRTKEADAKKQASKDKKAATKAKAEARKAQAEQEAKTARRQAEAQAAAAAEAQAAAAAAAAAPAGEKKKGKKKAAPKPESDDDEDDFALRAAQMGMAKKKVLNKK